MADIFDMVDTWNAGATTFTAIKMNVTDTASAAGSSLLDLQLAGTTVLRLQKNGLLQFGGTTSSFPAFLRAGAAMTCVLADGSLNAPFIAGSITMAVDAGAISLGASGDIILRRDAANALAQRNGVNAQSFRVYNTFTDSSNFERGQITWSGNSLIISSENSGTGLPRGLIVRAASNLSLSGSSSTGEQWAILSTGTLRPNPHNTHDIGSSSVRVKDIWLAGSLNSGGSIATESGNLRITNDAGVMSWGASNDVNLLRDGAANTLAQRNGTNAQVFRVYNTFTDASNYERGAMAWVSNSLVITSENLGASTARSITLRAADTLNLSGSAGSNGQWQILNSGVFRPGADNTFDIGQSGVRPRNLYMASWIRMATTVVASLPAAATAGAGARMFVTDALTPTFGSAVTGGGAVTVPVYSTGSAWNVG